MDKTCLITGASGGIGYEFAKLFAADKYNLVLVARNKEKLEKVAAEIKENYQVEVETIAKDLSMPGSAPELVAELTEHKLDIEVLINNAGVGLNGFFIETSAKKELDMMQLNIVSLTHLTKLLLPAMIEKKRGRILNVASMAAFFPGPCMAVYYATKAYVLSFSQALSNELEGTGVTCTALCPGGTKTNFFIEGEMGNSELIKKVNLATASSVAKEGYQGLMRSKTVVVPGFRNKFNAFVTRFIPRKTLARITRKIQEK